MKLHVAYNHNGRILAAAEEGSDQPAHGEGVTIAEMEVPAELAKRKPAEFMHLLRVDVAKKKLVHHQD